MKKLKKTEGALHICTYGLLKQKKTEIPLFLGIKEIQGDQIVSLATLQT